MGGVDQRLFGSLANAGFGFAVDGIEDEPRRQADDQEITEEKADGDVHGSIRRRP
ncbi:hypothetical protein SDC9_179424 [bioreactor metagenome]|uniref:Uncharacterized protein n=1 Tax=bioreactor metagenome TaxID=1076179 RepID=A0A645H1T7_9ZZZZ